MLESEEIEDGVRRFRPSSHEASPRQAGYRRFFNKDGGKVGNELLDF